MTCGRCCAKLWAAAEPSAVIIDARTLRSSPESGERAGYDGKRKNGEAAYAVAWVLALRVTANVDERAEVGHLTQTVQAVTNNG